MAHILKEWILTKNFILKFCQQGNIWRNIYGCFWSRQSASSNPDARIPFTCRKSFPNHRVNKIRSHNCVNWSINESNFKFHHHHGPSFGEIKLNSLRTFLSWIKQKIWFLLKWKISLFPKVKNSFYIWFEWSELVVLEWRSSGFESLTKARWIQMKLTIMWFLRVVAIKLTGL